MRLKWILSCAGVIAGAAIAFAPEKVAPPTFKSLDACHARENELSALAYNAQEKQRGFTKASAGWTAADAEVRALWKRIDDVSTQCLRLKLKSEHEDTSIKSQDGNADALSRMINNERSGRATAPAGGYYRGSSTGAAQTSESLKRQASESGWQAHEQQVAAANARAEQQIREMEATARAESERWAAIHAEEEERAARVRSQNSFLGIAGGILNQTARNVAAARSGMATPGYVSPGYSPAPRATPIPQELSLDQACPGLMNALEQSYRNANLPSDAGICARLRQELATDRQSADLLRQCRHSYATEAMPNLQQKIAGEVNAGFSAGCGSL